MADETRNANVVVSADVSGYTQGTQQAYRDTNKLIESVNKLSTSLDGITKRIGKKIMLFSAADVATMTAMVTITARYEKQLATLNAQLSLSGKNLAIYKKGIDEISRSMPATRGELTQLATQIHELGVQSEREAVKMTRTFTQLAAATGESVSGLTQGMIELSRQMGTLNNGATGIENFSDSLTMVASSAGVSATAVLNFAQSISPFARAAGLGQKELMGISAAFTRAGADGFAAANAFNTILADITRQIQTGSPEIAKYSNAVGMTMESFKQMAPEDQLISIFEAVNKAGPDAIKLLDRMGIDGIRAAKAIQAVSNESGGLRKAIETATEAYGGGATQKGADAALNTLDSKVTVLRNNLQQMGSAIGEGVMPFAKALLDTFNIMLTKVNDLAQPLLTLAGALGAILAPVTAALGGLTAMMGPLSTAMLAMTAIRFSPMRSLFAGIGAGRTGEAAPGFAKDANGNFTRVGGVPYWQRGPYGLGQRLGGMMGPPPPPGQMGFFARSTTNLANWAVTNRLGIGAADIMRAQATLYDNASLRQWWNRQSMVGDMTASGAGAIGRGWAATRAAVRNPMDFFRGMRNDPLAAASPGMSFAPTASGRAAEIRNAAVMAGNTTATAANTGAKAGNTVATGANTTVMRSLAGAAGTATRALLQMQLASARFALSMGAQGLGAAGRGVLGMVGGMVGASGPAAPVIGGLLVAGGAAYVMKNKQDELASQNIITPDTQRNIAATNAELGIATDALGDFTDIVKSGKTDFSEFVNVTDAMTMAMYDATAALGEYTDKNVENLTTVDQAIGYLQAQGLLDPAQAASLAADMTKRFTLMDSERVASGYLDVTNGGEDPYAPGMFSRLTSGAVRAQQNNQGFEGPLHIVGQLFTGEAMSKQIETGWAAMLEDLDLTKKTYGDKVVSQKLGVYLNDAMTAAFDEQTAAGVFNQGKVQEQFIKQMEGIFGEGKFTISAAGVNSGGFGFMRSKEEFFKSLFDEGNDSDMGVNFREWAAANGMTVKDFTGEGAKGLADRMSKGMTEGQYSDWEKGVRSTSLGAYARGNSLITSVTSGDKIADPASRQQAIALLANEAMRTGKSLGEVTSDLQFMKQAVGDMTDNLYLAASAAQQYANTQMAIDASISGGSIGEMGAKWDQAQAVIDNPVNTDEGEQAFATAVQTQVDIRNQALAQLKQFAMATEQYDIQSERSQKDHEDSLFMMAKDYRQQTLWAEQDYNRQRVYAMEDFARSMKRAAEDAAKSMYDPFTRVSARGTQSSGMVAFNLDRQLKLIKDQTKNIGILRDRGLDQRTIDNLNLTDPSMAYQVQRWVDEGSSFKAKALNKSGGAARVTAAGNLLDQQEGTRRTREDFGRQMERGADAFELTMERAAKGYDKQLWRMGNSYEKSLTRAAEDFDRYNMEILGGFETTLDTVKIKFAEVFGADAPLPDFIERLIDLAIQYPGVKDTEVPQWPESTDPENTGGTGESPGHASGRKPGEVYAVRGMNSDGGYTDQWFYTTPKGKTIKLPANWAEWTDPMKEKELAKYKEMAAGGVVSRRTIATVGEAGPEAVIPLNRAGGQFLGKIYGDITMEMVKGLRTAGFGTPGAYSVNGGGHTTINKNTQFLGPITVQAQDPNEMARKLEQKKRLENMRRGANASI
jgi:TP901 family phage tail tape measure protein